MKEQDAAHSFDKEILEKHITYRQLLTFENYSCVGIPYTDALKAIQSVTAELTRLRSELQQERDKARNQAIQDCIAHVHGYCNATTADTLVKKLESIKTKP